MILASEILKAILYPPFNATITSN